MRRVSLVAFFTHRGIPFLLLPLWAQLTLNPHSGYGIGFPHLPAPSSHMGMGRLSTVGAATNLPEQPAHSAHLPAMQTDFSGYARTSVLSSPAQRAQGGVGGLQNLQLSFARGKGWGFALGLTPQAIQGYLSSQQLSQPTPVRYTEKSDGILSLAYMQLAFRWRQLALGYQLGYLWGNYDRERSLQGTTQTLPDYLLSQVRLAGLQHRVGLLWQDSIQTAIYQVSVCYALPTSLHQEVLYRLQKNFSLTNLLLDTLALVHRKWRYFSPWRAGAYVATERWAVGAEGGYSPPADTWEGPGLTYAQATSSWDVRIGVEWVPDPRSPIFYRRLRYQGGGFLTHPPYATALRWYGLTGGVGWQFPRSPNFVYLSIERGWLPHPVVAERYFQVSIGMVFRELWFIPPRID
ncbi:MAG: hypothetical protein N2170_02465 [Bacteroidia bacterium]|nr:hypothetical protein [Bacteroidia bacterium]